MSHRRAVSRLCAIVAGVLLAGCGAAATPPETGLLPGQAPPPPVGTPAPTPAPTATPAVVHPAAAVGRALPAAPARPAPFRLRIPSVGIDVPVIAVGLTRQGAMDAPEGPLGSPFWREGFWLDRTQQPGEAGTATIAGHLDDTAGRPAAFWTLRSVRAGAIIEVDRAADSAVLHFQVDEVDVLTDAQAQSSPWLQRLYGPAAGGTSDGVARLSMITCTGTWHPGSGYDHRFLVFAEQVP